MHIDRNGLQILGRQECLQLLGTATLGRVGVTSKALPIVVPVNFLLDGDRILIRSGDGSRLSAALENAVVAFEADDLDPIYHSGWSVMVTGFASVVTDAADLDRLRTAPLPRWARSRADHIVAISTELISGRRLVAV